MRDSQVAESLIQKRLAQSREHVPGPKRLLVINFDQPVRERSDAPKADLTGRQLRCRGGRAAPAGAAAADKHRNDECLVDRIHISITIDIRDASNARWTTPEVALKNDQIGKVNIAVPILIFRAAADQPLKQNRMLRFGPRVVRRPADDLSIIVDIISPAKIPSGTVGHLLAVENDSRPVRQGRAIAQALPKDGFFLTDTAQPARDRQNISCRIVVVDPLGQFRPDQ